LVRENELTRQTRGVDVIGVGWAEAGADAHLAVGGSRMEAGRRCVSPSRAAAGFGAAPTVPVPAAATGIQFHQPRMVLVMRRKIAMVALLGGLAAGLGCHHIAGKNDCGYNPSDYQLSGPTPPYPSTPARSVPAPIERVPDKPAEKMSDSGLPVIENGN
jgi:hypothetical protein